MKIIISIDDNNIKFDEYSQGEKLIDQALRIVRGESKTRNLYNFKGQIIGNVETHRG